MRETMISQQQDYLDGLADQLRQSSLETSTQVVWEKHEDQAILEHYADQPIELILKPSAHHFFAASLFRQPEEWRLCRLPKRPLVLLQSPMHDLQPGDKLLLAVDVTEQVSGQSQRHNI